MIDGLFDRTISVLSNTLDLRAARQRVLASNISNEETPGYRAADINFEDELRVRDNAVPGVRLVTTSGSHMPSVKGINGEPAVVYRDTEPQSYDKNSVGIEGEMVKLSENSLMYTAASRMLRTKFGILMTAIKEGGK